MLWPALQVIQSVMCTVRHIGHCRKARRMLGVQEAVNTAVTVMLCIYRPTAFITWQAGCTAYLLPFDTDMWCLLVTDAAQYWSQRSQMTFCIVFFQSQSIICLMMATNATPGTLMELWIVAACLLRSHLPQMNGSCVCMWEGLSEWMCVCVCLHVDVHVQEDVSLTTHSLFDAFNSA